MEDITTLLKEYTEGIKRYNKELEEDFKRHIGVLKEDFDGKINLLAESVSGVQEQLVAIRNMVAKNTEDIEIIKMDIGIIKNNLKEKVDRDEFIALEKRVHLLEKKLQRT